MKKVQVIFAAAAIALATAGVYANSSVTITYFKHLSDQALCSGAVEVYTGSIGTCDISSTPDCVKNDTFDGEAATVYISRFDDSNSSCLQLKQP